MKLPKATLAAHGAPGTGKTEFARSVLESGARVAFISSEGGWSTVGDCFAKLGGLPGEGKQLTLFEMVSEADFAKLGEDEQMTRVVGEIATKAIRNFRASFEFIRTHLSEFDWWMDDGFSRFARMILAWADRQKEKGEYDTHSGDPNIQKMFGDIAAKLGAAVTLLHSLPLNGYINTLSEWEYEFVKIPKQRKDGSWEQAEKPTGKKWLAPLLVGRKVGASFPADWSALLHFFTKREPLTRERRLEGKLIQEPILDALGKPSTRLHFWANTQRDSDVMAKLRLPANASVPRYLHLGSLEPDGTRVVGEWSLLRLHDLMTGREGAK